MRGFSCTKLGNMTGGSFAPQLFTLLLCLTWACVHAEWSRYCPATSERTMAQGICGSNLANIVRDICRSYGYNSQRIYKRDAAPSKEIVKQHGGPFISKAVAHSYLQKRHLVSVDGQTFRQGIVCECCVNRCGLSELREYCAPPEMALYSKRGGLINLYRKAQEKLSPEKTVLNMGSPVTGELNQVFSGESSYDSPPDKSSLKDNSWEADLSMIQNMDRNEEKGREKNDMELDLEMVQWKHGKPSAGNSVDNYKSRDSQYTEASKHPAFFSRQLDIIRNRDNDAEGGKKND